MSRGPRTPFGSPAPHEKYQDCPSGAAIPQPTGRLRESTTGVSVSNQTMSYSERSGDKRLIHVFFGVGHRVLDSRRLAERVRLALALGSSGAVVAVELLHQVLAAWGFNTPRWQSCNQS